MVLLQSMLVLRSIYSEVPPNYQSREDVNPTLLICWWATIFSIVIILVRVCGRYVRVERFFREDKLMMASTIPLLIRMGFVHVVLLWGTNNTETAGLSPDEIRHREIGSRLVLAARIFYAVFIWTVKLTVCEFLKRVSGMIWRRSVIIFLRLIYIFLASTLVAIVVATLAECHPFTHYWQVVPDPGPQCRSGYANLIAMGACDAVSDLLLVAFPVPIILTARMSWKRKLLLAILFSFSLVLVAITCYRVPMIIFRNGSQQFRSLWASMEILAATAVSNAVVIGSFVKDRGVKKPKYKRAMGTASVSESLDHSSLARATLTYHQWGSDSDLAADLGIRLHPNLHFTDPVTPRPAPIAYPIRPFSARSGTLKPNWNFTQPPSDDTGTSASVSSDMRIDPHEYIETNETSRQGSQDRAARYDRKVSILDIKETLDPSSSSSTDSPLSPAQSDPELTSRDTRRSWRGSRAFLQDIGGLLGSGEYRLRTLRSPQPANSSLLETPNDERRSGSHSTQNSDFPNQDILPDTTGPVTHGIFEKSHGVGEP